MQFIEFDMLTKLLELLLQFCKTGTNVILRGWVEIHESSDHHHNYVVLRQCYSRDYTPQRCIYLPD